MEKYRQCRLELEADGSLARLLRFEPSPLAAESDLLLVHDGAYVERVRTGRLSEEEQRVVGFPWSAAHVQRSLASTGGTVAATHAVLRRGGAPVSMQLAGGTHHAFRDRGEGFCVFNDIAVAAAVARRDYGVGTPGGGAVLIVDLDVHQGNGTAAIFEGDQNIITFSMHGEKNYPYVGRSRMRSTYDVELPDGTGDDAYLSLLDDWLPRLFDAHAPVRLVFFQAGVDPLQGDLMGRLSLSRAGMLRRNNAVYSACLARGVPLVIAMGGGYCRPIEHSIAAHADVFRSAAYRFAAAAAAAAGGGAAGEAAAAERR